MTTPYPKTCKALEAWGIDPNTVAADGLSDAGYTVFLLDDEGKKRIDWESSEQRAMVAFVPWQPGQEGIYEIYRAEVPYEHLRVNNAE